MVLIHRLEPAGVIVRVTHDVDVPAVTVLPVREHELTSADAYAQRGGGHG